MSVFQTKKINLYLSQSDISLLMCYGSSVDLRGPVQVGYHNDIMVGKLHMRNIPGLGCGGLLVY